MKQIKHESKIINDKYTEYIYQAFDIQDREQTTVEIKTNLAEIGRFDWQIGVVYGGSGTGKTSILKNYFDKDIDDAEFKDNISLISNFDWLEPLEATEILSAMGLASVPTWLRPFNTLSNGEQYRAKMAYVVAKAKEGEIILVDEYTSVVDRDVAKAMSNALQRYIRKTNKKIVLASCHFDIIEWLRPDWSYSPLKGRVERLDCLRRPRLELSVFRCRFKTWDIFKQYHYLTSDLNKAAKCFVFTMNDKPVAFCAVLPLPSGTLKDAYRMSRTVVLPDFQGLGIGGVASEYIASLYKALGYKFYAKTSNPALWKRRELNGNWRLAGVTSNVNEVKKENERYRQQGKTNFRREAITKSFEYIGEPSKDSTDIIEFDGNAYKDVAQNQISLF